MQCRNALPTTAAPGWQSKLGEDPPLDNRSTLQLIHQYSEVRSQQICRVVMCVPFG